MIDFIILIVIIFVSFLFGWTVARHQSADERNALLDLAIRQDKALERLTKKLKEKDDERKAD